MSGEAGWRRPNTFLLGAARSGTTAFASALGRHPDVFLPAVKEPHYYAYLADPTSARLVYPDEAHAHRRYRELYEGVADETAVCDASATNLVVPGVADAIARDAPHARFLVLLRHPVDRAHSHWSYFAAAGAEPLSFEEAVRTEAQRQADGMPFTYRYLGWSRYTVQLRPFLELFGRNRVQVHLYDDLVADSEHVLRSTFGFLGVDDTQPIPPMTTESVARGRRFAAVKGRPGRVVRRLTPGRWQYRPKPRLDPDLRARLVREEFSAEIASLESLLGRDLAGWRA